MRASAQFFLILSAITAVEAARGSKYRYGRPTTGTVAPVISSVPPEENGASTVSIIPTEAVKVPELANDIKDAKVRQTVTLSETATASLTLQSQVTIKSKATRAAQKEPTKKFCGKPNESEVLFGTPWIVFSMNYNYQSIKGSSCVGYYDYTGSGDDQTIHWSVLWDIDPDVGTNLVKGYNFIGLTQGLETRLSDIKSIPSKYEWTTSKTTEYKGNVVYDFMTCDTKGDSTSNRAQELMLWINWEGGQVPIGWGEGPIATIDGLFGKDGWKLYQGVNADTGITVTSLLCPEESQFGNQEGGSFEGDIKDWLVALSENGVFKANTYVNVGNAGMEPYYGTVDFDNHLSLRVNV
ncbi:concanavalin A-like lectin/glucanase domain-containing protein [Fusarium acuminatum]|uniref:Concanavalin A-like lectin/glucanase domain-containing protein n=1 Tax=Fusarium acuminatum TaxID=5515 RepID=A0ABZ2X0J4_9HYPO